jgi:ABC-type branched-subunit amino acid transport system substrate-binding protein
LRNSEAAANFEVIVKDSQSNPNRAADVAKELIIDDEIDMMLVASTPETTNPVATTCEAEGGPLHLHRRARGSPGSSASRATPATRQLGAVRLQPTTSSGGSRT